jgi:beta-lactamase class A
VTRLAALALLLAACTGAITGPGDEQSGDGPGDGDGKSDERGDAAAAADAAAAGPSAAELESLVTDLVAGAATRAPGAEVGIAVMHLGNGVRASAGGDTLFVSASSAKAWWVAAALAGVGVDPVEPYAEPIFANSDNGATGSVIDLVGPDAVNVYIWDVIGMDSTALTQWSYQKTREASNSPRLMGSDNYATADDAVTFLAALHRGEALGAAETTALLDWMRLSPRSGFGGWLGTPLPEPVRATLAHKGGWLPPGCCSDDAYYNTLNDVGIVTAEDGTAYAIAIFSHGGDDWYGQQQPYVEYAACSVYRFMIDDPSIACE